jgi:DNA-binding Xre family transcriptional regulator
MKTQSVLSSTPIPRLSVKSIHSREDLVQKVGLSKKELSVLLDGKNVSLYEKTLEVVAIRIHKNADFLIEIVGNVWDKENETAPVKKELSKKERIENIKDTTNLLKGNKTSYDQLKRKPSVGSKSELFIKAYFGGDSIYRIAANEGSPYSFVRSVLLRYGIIKEKL